MTDPELSDLLRKAKTPSRAEEYWEEFPGVVSRGIARGEPGFATGPRRSRLVFATAWAVSFATLCVLTGFWFGKWHKTHLAQGDEVAQARKLVAELATLFPNQVQSIVIENGRTELHLSENADVPRSTAILLRICGKSGCEKVITFSGQQVRVNGQPCDVLVDSRGNVIVAGSRFVWSTTGGAGNSSGAQIHARSLGDVL